MKTPRGQVAGALLALLLLAACTTPTAQGTGAPTAVVQLPPTYTPMPTYTPAPTYTPVPTYTPMPTYTPPQAPTLSQPSPTPSPSATPTARPTRTLVCNACFTEWNLDSLKGVRGGCIDYPPEVIPSTVEKGMILIDEKVVLNWKPRV